MLTFPVIPAFAGIQGVGQGRFTLALDSGLRRNDEIELVKSPYGQMSTLPSWGRAAPHCNEMISKFTGNIFLTPLIDAMLRHSEFRSLLADKLSNKGLVHHVCGSVLFTDTGEPSPQE